MSELLPSMVHSKQPPPPLIIDSPGNKSWNYIRDLWLPGVGSYDDGEGLSSNLFTSYPRKLHGHARHKHDLGNGSALLGLRNGLMSPSFEPYLVVFR